MEQIINLSQPPLLIGEQTEPILRSIARAAMVRAPKEALRLLCEVDRADLIVDRDLPADVVTIDSFVTYRVALTGSINTIRLVRPHEADPAKLRVSIVSGIGAALIGLKVGQQIQWELGRHQHSLEVIRVSKEP